MTDNEWRRDVERAHKAARRAADLAYGPWKVVEVSNAVVAYENHLGCFRRVDRAYAVTDLTGKVVATVEHRAVAELLAGVPDLCDPCLRPAHTVNIATASFPDTSLGVRAFLKKRVPAADLSDVVYEREGAAGVWTLKNSRGGSGRVWLAGYPVTDCAKWARRTRRFNDVEFSAEGWYHGHE